MEEAWYNTSTAGKNYIEISEGELLNILNGIPTDNIINEGREMDILFRL